MGHPGAADEIQRQAQIQRRQGERAVVITTSNQLSALQLAASKAHERIDNIMDMMAGFGTK
jgi:hypothetical protein